MCLIESGREASCRLGRLGYDSPTLSLLSNLEHTITANKDSKRKIQRLL